MKKLEKLILMGIIVTAENILVFNKDTDNEYYIDPRTIKNDQCMAIVKPIAENSNYIWYVCPFCQDIHIESKRCLNVNNKIIWTNCKYRNRLLQYIIIDCEVNPIAFQDVKDDLLVQEYRFMQNFERRC